MQASDGMFHSNCSVNITVLDVNNNAPVFSEDSYSAVVMEDTPVGKYLTELRTCFFLKKKVASLVFIICPSS